MSPYSKEFDKRYTHVDQEIDSTPSSTKVKIDTADTDCTCCHKEPEKPDIQAIKKMNRQAFRKFYTKRRKKRK